MNSENPLVGTWTLVAIRAIAADGSVDPEAYGPSPVGRLMYTADGYMTVLFAQGDRPPLSGNPTSPFDLADVPATERAQAFSSFSAYAGTYTLAGDSVTHHVAIASIPNRVGTDLVRIVALEGDRLTLKTPPGRDSLNYFELVWQKSA
ncbi:MAG: lipocalin-like domain-containing protein [Elainellaceae cyanobacterium]